MPCLKLGCSLSTDSRVTGVSESKTGRQLDIQFSCKNFFPLGNKKEKEMLKESRKYAVGSPSESHIWWFWPQWQEVTCAGIACVGPWRDGVRILGLYSQPWQVLPSSTESMSASLSLVEK